MDVQVYSSVERLRSRHPEVFCKKICSENFGNFTRKHLWWGLILVKLQPAEGYNFTKRGQYFNTFSL